MSYKEQLQQIYLRAPYALDKKFGPYANIAARDAIRVEERYPGMPAYVLDVDGQGTELLYRLVGGLANSNWVPTDSQGHIIQKDGNSFEQRAKLNFVGFPIVEDDPANDATKVILNYEPLQTLTITDINATAAIVLNSSIVRLKVTLDATLTVNWIPSAVNGAIEGRNYDIDIIKDADVDIDMSNTTNVIFPEDDFVGTTRQERTGINPYKNFIGVKLNNECTVKAKGWRNDKILMSKMTF